MHERLEPLPCRHQARLTPEVGDSGFSRNATTFPPLSYSTSPKGCASATRVSARLAAAPRERWRCTSCVTSTSVGVSPFIATKGSSRPKARTALASAPAVSRGDVPAKGSLMFWRGQQHLVDAMCGEMIYELIEQRAIDQRQKRLGDGFCQRTQARAFTPDQNNCLHRLTPRGA